MNTYKVVEIFESINGEGMKAGELSVFVRLCGCNLHCSYCDTSWANEKDAPYQEMTARQIVQKAEAYGTKNVTLTGGEPLLAEHVLELLEALSEKFCVEIETNGSIALDPFCKKDRKVIFTMDYKLKGSGMEEQMCLSNFALLQRDDTVKFVVSDQTDLERAYEIEQKYALGQKCHVLISPVFGKIIPADMVDENTKYFINPTGRFVIGGPHGDSGLTGRKIIVDTYGGSGRHGGGAFSGKDCTKVDRSAAYAARYVAKNIVAAGLADKCEIQLSYAIGVAKPTSINVETFGTGKLSNTRLVEIIRENFDLRPAGIIRMLDLRRPIYKQTAAYGHFGRTDVDLPWEKLDKVDDLKKYL